MLKKIGFREGYEAGKQDRQTAVWLTGFIIGFLVGACVIAIFMGGFSNFK